MSSLFEDSDVWLQAVARALALNCRLRVELLCCAGPEVGRGEQSLCQGQERVHVSGGRHRHKENFHRLPYRTQLVGVRRR